MSHHLYPLRVYFSPSGKAHIFRVTLGTYPTKSWRVPPKLISWSIVFRESQMAKVSPWYSIRQQDRNVYHDNTECPEGNEIDHKYRKAGHRCRVRCPRCAKWDGDVQTRERAARLIPLW